MTPEEYIDKLRKLRQETRGINHRVDDAISNMQRRLETGYTFLEDHSKNELVMAIEHASILIRELQQLHSEEITY